MTEKSNAEFLNAVNKLCKEFLQKKGLQDKPFDAILYQNDMILFADYIKNSFHSEFSKNESIRPATRDISSYVEMTESTNEMREKVDNFFKAVKKNEVKTNGNKQNFNQFQEKSSETQSSTHSPPPKRYCYSAKTQENVKETFGRLDKETLRLIKDQFEVYEKILFFDNDSIISNRGVYSRFRLICLALDQLIKTLHRTNLCPLTLAQCPICKRLNEEFTEEAINSMNLESCENLILVLKNRIKFKRRFR